MFGPKNVPKGVLSARPPAKGTASFFSSVWQPTQPAAFARYSPRFASPSAEALPAAAQKSMASTPARGTIFRKAGGTPTISRIMHHAGKGKPRRSGASSENPRSVLLTEILVAVPATSFADLRDCRLDARFVAGFGRGNKPANRALELFLRLLELGRLAPDRRQGGGFHVLQVLGAFREAVPGHLVQHIEITGIARDHIGVVRDFALGHAGQRAEVLALQGHRRLALFDQYLGLDLREGGERVSRAERQGQSGQKKRLLHSILLD